MQRFVSVLVSVLFLTSISCATGQRAHRDRDLITADEIATVPQADTAYDIIRYLRPNLLQRDTRTTGKTSRPVPALVYLNGARLGTREVLLTITSVGIVEIKYVDGFDAGGKYGFDSAGGVFVITVK